MNIYFRRFFCYVDAYLLSVNKLLKFHNRIVFGGNGKNKAPMASRNLNFGRGKGRCKIKPRIFGRDLKEFILIFKIAKLR